MAGRERLKAPSQPEPIWSTACPDWADRLVKGRSIIPPPLFAGEAAAGLEVFKSLSIVDMAGSPRVGDVSRQWILDLAAAVFGAYNPETGRRLITEFFVCVAKKNWKALSLDTPIATPGGFVPMGEVKVGDLVIDADGHPSAVIGKSEVFTGRPCFEVQFSTGERVVCDAEHLWVTDAHRDRQRRRGAARGEPAPSTKTTAQIAATLTVPSGELLVHNHRTALAGALDLPEAALPVAPYVLGAWLGDGKCTDGSICKPDAELWSGIRACGYRLGPPHAAATRPHCRTSTVLGLAAQLRALGVLGNKHIPQTYLRASHDQRLQLLRGLMDTDGTISAKGQAVFSTTTPALRDGVIELVASLGFKPTCSEHRARLRGKDCGPWWQVKFQPFDELVVFTIARKLARQRSRVARNAPRSRTRQIVAVRQVPSVPTQCIAVASPTHQFLVTRSLIPTHNSGLAAGVMLTTLVRGWRQSAQYLILAPTKDVADKAFGPALDMIRVDNELNRLLHVRESQRRITHRTMHSSLEVITPDSATGSKASAVLVDELWEFGSMSDAADVLREATGGLASRPEGFVLYMTTQSKKAPAGVFRDKLRFARSVRDGKVLAPWFLPVIYEYPRELVKAKAWRNSATWHIPNPNFGASVDAAFLERKLQEALQAGAEELSGFLAKHLNIEPGMAASDGWAGAASWDAQACPGGLKLEDLFERCDALTVGIDAGGSNDWMGLAVIGREIGTRRWLAWARAWVQEKALGYFKDEAPRWRDLAAEGDLVIVERAGQDIAQMVPIVRQVQDTGKLVRIGMDPAGTAKIIHQDLVFAGIDEELLVGIGQGFRLMGAILLVERKLEDGTLAHSGSSMLAYCAGNARTESRGNATIITKAASKGKVDPLLALIDAAECMAVAPVPFDADSMISPA